MLSLPIVLLLLSLAQTKPAEFTEDCRLREIGTHEYRRECGGRGEGDEVENCPRDYATRDMCCLCYDACCGEIGAKEASIIFSGDIRMNPAHAGATTDVKVIRIKDSTSEGDRGTRNVNITSVTVTQGINGNEGIITRIRRNLPSKTNRGTGEDVVVDDDEDAKNRNNNSFVRKELEEAIEVAVRVALNKLANTLKNVTEMENAGRDENSMSTTLSPPVESCSSKSKRCDEQEPDLLDEFFPPKHYGKGNKGKGRKRRETLLRPLFPRVAEIKNGADFGTSGGLIAKGEIIENTTRSGSVAIIQESTTTEPKESKTETTGTEKVVQRPSKPSLTKTIQGGRNGGGNQSDSVEVSSSKPTLMISALLVPKVRPGKCEDLSANKTCVSLLPDASQCTLDSECEGTKKCCFYGCKPYEKVGICSLPVFF